MKILLTNDDGIYADGIFALYIFWIRHFGNTRRLCQVCDQRHLKMAGWKF